MTEQAVQDNIQLVLDAIDAMQQRGGPTPAGPVPPGRRVPRRVVAAVPRRGKRQAGRGEAYVRGAANEREVIVLYRQRAVGAGGERLDSPVLDLYEVRDGKLGRARMFHYDIAALVGFLARANESTGPGPAHSQ
jgi:ketosteroid isomerase-like protein